MAKRKSKRSPRRKYKGAFKLMPVVFALATLNIFTRTTFNTNLPQFLLGGYVQGFGSAGAGSSNAITLKEIFSGANIGTGGVLVHNLGTSIGQNLRSNAVMGIMGLIGVKIAQKLVVSLGVNRSINKLSTSVGLGSTIRAN